MLKTKTVRDHADVAAHFDHIASDYHETHGPPRELLQQRLATIRGLYRGLARPGGVLLELGCGTATHLLELAPGFDRAVGADISPRMIELARRRVASLSGRATRAAPPREIELRVDVAEELSTVEDASVRVLVCVGALEHMLDRRRVMAQIARVLEPGGVLTCLTHNGDYVWYAHIAPALRISTRHLSTDRSLRASDLRALAAGAGLSVARVQPWTFIARGDMPRPWPRVLDCLDLVGRITGITSLRGGLAMAAVKPPTNQP